MIPRWRLGLGERGMDRGDGGDGGHMYVSFLFFFNNRVK